MNRILAAIRWDVVLQFRSGFYYATLLFIVMWVVALRWVGAYVEINFALVMPPLLLFNVLIAALYFGAGIMLLERGQRIHAGLAATPLRPEEFLAARIVSLSALSVVESFLITLLGIGFAFNGLLLVAALGSLAVLFVLIGTTFVSRYRSVNEFLLPSMLVVIVITLPLVGYFELWNSPVWYMHPIQPFLLLLRAAFEPITSAGWIYAVAGAGAWIAAGWVVAVRVVRRSFWQESAA